MGGILNYKMAFQDTTLKFPPIVDITNVCLEIKMMFLRALEAEISINIDAMPPFPRYFHARGCLH